MLGYCGSTRDHCRSPDCQLDYGSCDASRTPQGPSTIDIPRPLLGAVPYGQKVFACTVPRTVALTFDDGPHIYTSDVLDLLDSFNAKATFFISGVNSGKGQIDDFTLPWGQLIQRMHYSGHQIASHSWSHQDLSRISPSQRRDQILKNEAAIRNILGGIPTYMRPPYSSCTTESGCMDDMAQLGYHVTYFNLDTDDYNNDHPAYIQRSKDIFDRALAMQDPPGRPYLVIAHDVHEQTVHNLTAHILHTIHDAGYRPVTVGECLDDPRDFWYRWDYRAQNVVRGH
jgi:peptidoglycan/xylan/chitin deacetylase (PgdA/CDA1 family)